LDKTLKLEIGKYLREVGPRWDPVWMMALSKEYYEKYYK
jgi:hypothetical protein